MQPGDAAAQEGEACAGDIGTDLEIEAQHRADIGMFARLEVELALLAPGRQLDVFFLARALGHVVGGEVGNRGEHVVHLGAEHARVFLQPGQGGRLELGHLGLKPVGFLGIAAAHCLADRLGGGVAAVLRVLQFGQDGAAAGVEVEQTRGDRLCPATGERGVESFGLAADGGDVVHGSRLYEPDRAWPVSSWPAIAV